MQKQNILVYTRKSCCFNTWLTLLIKFEIIFIWKTVIKWKLTEIIMKVENCLDHNKEIIVFSLKLGNIFEWINWFCGINNFQYILTLSL